MRLVLVATTISIIATSMRLEFTPFIIGLVGVADSTVVIPVVMCMIHLKTKQAFNIELVLLHNPPYCRWPRARFCAYA